MGYISFLISNIIHKAAALADNQGAQWMAIIVSQSEREQVKGIPV